MTPNEQEAKSLRAYACPFLIIPHEDGALSLLQGVGAQTFLGTYLPEELLDYFRTSFAEGRATYTTRKQEAAAILAADSSLLADLGL